MTARPKEPRPQNSLEKKFNNVGPTGAIKRGNKGKESVLCIGEKKKSTRKNEHCLRSVKKARTGKQLITSISSQDRKRRKTWLKASKGVACFCCAREEPIVQKKGP